MTQKENNELLPCPFCGSNAYVWPDGKISCNGNSCSIYAVQFTDSHRFLAKKWNTRTQPSNEQLDCKTECRKAFDTWYEEKRNSSPEYYNLDYADTFIAWQAAWNRTQQPAQSIWKKYPQEKPDLNKTVHIFNENKKYGFQIWNPNICKETFYPTKEHYWCYESDLIASIQSPQPKEAGEVKQLLDQLDEEIAKNPNMVKPAFMGAKPKEAQSKNPYESYVPYPTFQDEEGFIRPIIKEPQGDLVENAIAHAKSQHSKLLGDIFVAAEDVIAGNTDTQKRKVASQFIEAICKTTIQAMQPKDHSELVREIDKYLKLMPSGFRKVPTSRIMGLLIECKAALTNKE